MNRDILERPFPDALLKTRKGPFNHSFSYVEGTEYIRRLNEAFEAEWSFEILEHSVRENEVIVLAKLTAGGVAKTSFGGSSITVSREGEIISIADDLKAAATDALKKASSLFGVGLHLYSESQPADTKPTNGRSTRPAAKSESKGNGKTPGNGSNGANTGQCATGTVSGDRLTQRQLSAIWSMGRSLNLNADAIRDRSVKVFGVVPEQLSKSDASSFIGELGEALSSPASAA